MKSIWKKISHIGIRGYEPHDEQRYIQLVNRVIFLACVFTPAFIPLLIITGNGFATFSQSCFSLLFPFCFIPCLYHRHRLGAILTFALLLINLTMASVANFNIGSEYLLLPVSLIAFMTFRKFNESLVVFFVTVGVFFLVQVLKTVVSPYVVMEENNRLLLFHAILFMCFIVILFAMYNFKSVISHYEKATLEQKADIERQKHVIEEKQKEIIDSINYARRIQSAILSREEEIKKYFPESFLLYKPKDIVAGDFYFFETTDTHVFYAAADCTGHGVPGALVSVVCSNALTRCVKEFGLTDPGKILDRTRELVLETFKKSGQDVKDGMDISLISLKAEHLTGFENLNDSNDQTLKYSNIQMEWAGANNPLWVLRKEGSGMEEIAPDKQPIGLYEHAKPFTTHKVQLQKGDSLFLFTDGYADQFGGEKGKKFKYKNLAKLLESSSGQPMPQQVQVLDHGFEQWRGSLEQVDDVCVIGVKFS